MNKVMIIWILSMLLLVSSVTAWGVLPARQLAEYSYQTQDLSVTLRNTDYQEGYFNVRFAGALASYASYEGGVVYVGADDYDVVVPFSLTLPNDVESGRQSLRVILEQQPSQVAGSTVTSLISLATEVVVNVPVQGAEVHGTLDIQAVPTDRATPITLSLLNKGEDDVVVWSDVSIYSPTNTLLANYETPKQLLPYLGTGKIESFWEGPRNAGVYSARVILYYGDETKQYTATFTVGNQEVVLLEINAEDFLLGNINPIELTVQNGWNEPIFDVYADIFVLQNGVEVQKFSTAPEDVYPLSKENLIGYWDTSSLLVGSYELLIVLHHNGLSSQYVKPASVSVSQVDFTGAVISRGEEPRPYGLFAVLLLVIVALNVLVLYYIKKSSTKKRRKKKKS